MKDIIIYGAGGFGKEVACLLRMINIYESSPIWNFKGFIDDNPNIKYNSQGKVIGNRDYLLKHEEPLSVIITIANPRFLEIISKELKVNIKLSFPNILAPNIIIFDQNSLSLGEGNVIFGITRLSCDVTIGNFNILNGAVSLGHDVSIGNFNVLGPSTRLSGNCTVGNNNFFGLNSAVLQGINIGSETRIGAGSIVMRNTRDGNLYHGNPAKKYQIE